MKEICIDRAEGKVVLSPSPLTFTINVEDDFNTTKIIEVQDGEIQKTNNEEQLLYLDSEGNETTDSMTVTKYEEKEVTNKWVDEEGVEHSETVTVNFQ